MSILQNAECFHIPKYVDNTQDLIRSLKDDRLQYHYLYFYKDDNIVKIRNNRKTFWYGDQPQAVQKENRFYIDNKGDRVKIPTDYVKNYEFDSEILNLKKRIEKEFSLKFNSCLVSLYSSPDDKMDYHSDKGPDLGDDPIIASISLGVRSKFNIKSKESDEKLTLELDDGDLLILGKNTNRNYLHEVPKNCHLSEERFRLNLTFRYYNY